MTALCFDLADVSTLTLPHYFMTSPEQSAEERKLYYKDINNEIESAVNVNQNSIEAEFVFFVILFSGSSY